MKAIDPKFLTQSRAIFTSVAGMNLQQLRDQVAAQAIGTIRRDQLSALDTAARVFGRPLVSIRATPGAVRDLFGTTAGPEVGVSAKRLANIRSDVGKALRLYGAPVPAITKRIPLAPDWSQLLYSVEIRHHRMALNRFACFCSAVGIGPTAVGPDALLGFHSALDAEEVVKNPLKLLKMTIAIWNMCRRGVSGWTDITLSSPYKTTAYTLPLSAFPESFQQDVRTWVARVTEPDPLDPDAPSRPLRSATIKCRIVEIRRFASALIHQGTLTVCQVTSLRVLYDGDNFKSSLRFFLKRFDNKPTAAIEGMANHLRHIAKHYCKVDSKTLEALTAVCSRLDSGSSRHMSSRNRERLRQFDDPKKVAKLLAFPAEERVRGLKQRNQIRAARCMERALAIDLLIQCCLRMQNLHTIHLTRNLCVTGGQTYLTFEGNEVKNNQLLDFELSNDVADALTEFCKVHRPCLPGAGGPYLFPGRNGGPKSHGAMRSGIEGALRKRSGLLMHPHLFRHAIAKIVVERNPDLYPAISQHLGHKRLDMTMAHYLGTETRASARHIDRLLSATRADPTLKKD